MMVELRVKQTIEAAHKLLADVPECVHCRGLHGHRYEIEVCVAGEIDSATGQLISYEKLAAKLANVLSQVDHQVLNDAAPAIGDPTTENFCVWLWDRLGQIGLREILSSVKIQETENTSCTYRGK